MYEADCFHFMKKYTQPIKNIFDRELHAVFLNCTNLHVTTQLVFYHGLRFDNQIR